VPEIIKKTWQAVDKVIAKVSRLTFLADSGVKTYKAVYYGVTVMSENCAADLQRLASESTSKA